MKTHKVLLLASILAVGVAAPVFAGHHGDGGSNASASSAPAHNGGSAVRSGAQGFRYSGGQGISSRYRFSSTAGPMSGQRRFAPGAVTGRYHPVQLNNARSRNLAAAHTNHLNANANANRNRNGGLNNGRNHIFAQHSANWHRDWDRHHDHWWNGHRCRFVNGSWFIFDLGFYPWWDYPYGYAYDGYYGDPYYGSGYGYGYDNGYANGPGVYEGANVYGDQPAPADGSDYGNQGGGYQNGDSPVAAVQERLAKQGYYRGQIDGVLGPSTRSALMTYQRRNRLRVTGSLTPETLQSFNLAGAGNGD